ncbi:MAG: SulP family inorganic anion transporter [Rhodoluna sp.]|nr:SulP family inorganic anion transporter [Rhodoluna sp.]
MNLLPTKADLDDALAAPLKNLLSGITVAIVALPLALAFGLASGMGAEAGITTAIIAGALAAIFGGSRLQVSGPTGAMTVVLVPIFKDFGASGVLFVGLVAGALLVLIALLKIGEHVHRLPTSLIEGFTAGIAVIISLQQFPYLDGWQKAVFGLTVTALILVGQHYWPRLPFAFILVILATVAADVLGLNLERIGELPASIGQWDTEFLNQGDWLRLIPSALAVTILAALESLLSAKVADRMRGGGEKHDANKELFGQGVANLVVPFFGGVPATAALARTAVNVRSGATSKSSALIHSIVLAAVILLAAPLVAKIPLAALAGVLLATTAHMVKPKELIHIARISWLDAIVMVATFIATVTLNLISGVLVGLALALALRKTKLGRISRTYPVVDEAETLGD